MNDDDGISMRVERCASHYCICSACRSVQACDAVVASAGSNPLEHARALAWTEPSTRSVN